MGLSTALGVAISGLNVTQAELNLTAQNIANANTAGYTRKTLQSTQQVAGDRLIGISASQIQRSMDLAVQSQLRLYASDAEYSSTLAGYAQRVDFLFGEPGGPTALDTQFNDFMQALEGLSTTPESSADRYQVVNTAAALANQLNLMSSQLQAMRTEADSLIAAQTAEANDLLTQIEELNGQVRQASSDGTDPVGLMDLRDGLVDRLSSLLDINIQSTPSNGIRILTDSGVTLFSGTAAQLSFDATGTVNAQTEWSSDPNVSDLGSVTLGSLAGTSVDLFSSNILKSGSIAALRDARDDLLVQTQAQLDELAHHLAMALSVVEQQGTAVAAPPVNYAGFDLDLNDWQQGNELSLNFDQSGTDTTVRFIRVDDSTLLPLGDDATADPNDRVIGIDFSAGVAGALAGMQAALDSEFGAGAFTLSDQGGEVLRVLDDGLAGTITINDLMATKSSTSLQDGTTALPFFTDGAANGSLYTGDYEGISQKVGFAGRIQVNPTLMSDTSYLIAYGAGTAAGDVARPNAILDALTATGLQFAASDGGAPFTGSVSTYLSSVIATQGATSAQLSLNVDSRETAFNQLKSRFDDDTKVNIDTELARLVELQTAYAANARIITAVKEMMDVLLRT